MLLPQALHRLLQAGQQFCFQVELDVILRIKTLMTVVRGKSASKKYPTPQPSTPRSDIQIETPSQQTEMGQIG